MTSDTRTSIHPAAGFDDPAPVDTASSSRVDAGGGPSADHGTPAASAKVCGTPDTFGRLCRILMRDYPLTQAQLVPEAPLDSLGIDSLGVAELLFNIDDEFGVSVSPPDDPASLQTLDDVVRFIDEAIAAQTGADRLGAPSAGREPMAPEQPGPLDKRDALPR